MYPARFTHHRLVLGLASEAKVVPVIVLLDRFCAMVTRLGGLGSR